MSAAAWLGVAAAGGVGALARFLLDGAVSLRAGSRLPLGTLVVNVSGALALGLLSGASVGGSALLVAGTGALGSYTTFSTWMLETQRLAEDGEGRAALANVAVSLAAGLAAAALGRTLGAAL
ncbi:MAG: fluoride efflux transporter CrcB [Thermoleophilaceae bacterium]|nr:fluoride efflux transporter CrcB [Thermoleophilaceae bacterium]